MGKALTVIAIRSTVVIVGEDGTSLPLTPDLAERIAVELCRKAVIARALADGPDDTPAPPITRRLYDEQGKPIH